MALWHAVSGGVIVSIRAKPGARCDAIDGLREDADGARAIKVCVSAALEKGKANTAAIAVLAKHFGFAKSAIGIVSGTASRTKQVMISGDPEQIGKALIAGLKDLTDGRG